MEENKNTLEYHTFSVGEKAIIDNGMCGTITKLTQSGTAWIRVRSRWCNHHHPVTGKTLKVPLSSLMVFSASHPSTKEPDNDKE